MKLIFFILFAGLMFDSMVTMANITCWFCSKALNDTQCVETGFARECEHDQICFTEQRFENGQYMRENLCKQKAACVALKREEQERCPTFVPPHYGGEDCKEKSCVPRLCRECCWWEDLCNLPKHVDFPQKDETKTRKKLTPALLVVMDPKED